MKFTKIPSDAFQKLQINAGILTTDFTPATGTDRRDYRRREFYRNADLFGLWRGH